ncbi:hypothetical protein O1R50_05165 [Glycomyces luteolus]|uniref:CsbD family protein n=1 Tax=Glycomyces luteolus TaxID=2670330 RepID=A0A9X3PI92_9ACTN|nr:hypothetical protein [Glycomyces luteolus]MDA1359000.1 hypothetical protein [Glycomyces luteolus]
MGFADKFNELKDMFSGAVEDAKGKAEEMIGGVTDAPVDQLGEQVGGAAEDLQGQAQEGVENAQGQVQEGVDGAQGSVEDFRNQTGL